MCCKMHSEIFRCSMKLPVAVFLVCYSGLVITRRVAVLSGNLPYPSQTAQNSGETPSGTVFSHDVTLLTFCSYSWHTHAHHLIQPSVHFSPLCKPECCGCSRGTKEGLNWEIIAKSSLTCQYMSAEHCPSASPFGGISLIDCSLSRTSV